MSNKTLKRVHEFWQYGIPETGAKSNGCIYGGLEELIVMQAEEVNKNSDAGVLITLKGKEDAYVSVELEVDDARTLANWLLSEAEKAERKNIKAQKGGEE